MQERIDLYIRHCGTNIAAVAKPIFYLSLLFLLAVGVTTADASDDFRCGADIISIGNRKTEVLRKCGEPVYVETWEETRIRRDFGSRFLIPGEESRRIPLLTEERVTVEEWEYNLGPTRFVRYLRFENGRLIRITLGDYGY